MDGSNKIQGEARRKGGLRYLLLRWEEVLAALALIVVVGSVGFGVISRHVMSSAATWTVELSTLAFTWAVFFGAAAAFRRDMHVRIDLLTNLMPPRLHRLTGFAVNLLILGFLGYTLYYAVQLSISSAARPSPILRIPFTWVYGAVAASVASMVVHQIAVILKPDTTRGAP
nr:TRAP transporter small permease [Oceaniglobus trochenteri]